jgi:hypothetical protein
MFTGHAKSHPNFPPLHNAHANKKTSSIPTPRKPLLYLNKAQSTPPAETIDHACPEKTG